MPNIPSDCSIPGTGQEEVFGNLEGLAEGAPIFGLPGSTDGNSILYGRARAGDERTNLMLIENFK